MGPQDQEDGVVVGREGISPRTGMEAAAALGEAEGMSSSLGRVGKELVFLLRQL